MERTLEPLETIKYNEVVEDIIKDQVSKEDHQSLLYIYGD